MKKILNFVVAFAISIGIANAAVRDGNPASRGGATTTTNVQKRISTTDKKTRAATPRTTVLNQTRTATNSSRGMTARTATSRTENKTTKSVTARAVTDEASADITETRTGAQYETCKTAFFTCMDQFCALKNDDYRRCSCSNRVDGLAASREVLTEAGEQLTIFTENLDTVGMTAAQAAAMRTASEGENALTTDTSASKALLQAIMNSIRGGDTTVGGQYSTLNSINLAFDTSVVFGNDSSQIIATYNGQNLYSAVYPQCRNAVRADCNDASLQRAVTAYLMAIEQDCNTVQTAIEQKQKEVKTAVREGSALLDLARVENRQKHNSDDITTCINNVEEAILSEEVCGANYHKCLDNGEFIDISTGAPITGIENFAQLGKLLQFNSGTDVALQQLSKITKNKIFVSNFEKRTKKFARPALDKCRDIADTVWEEYLDKAMLSIYYAQQSKVSDIKQGCFDFISQCYESSDASITAAMAQLVVDSTVLLQPDKLALSTQLCQRYITSCDNMFKSDDESTSGIIAEYVETRQNEDILSACRAVVKQCFDKYGGTGYENFYYPYSGLFDTGKAPDWFSLYDTDGSLKSPCAKELAKITSCNTDDLLERAFGGFDVFWTHLNEQTDKIEITSNPPINENDPGNNTKRYGLPKSNNDTAFRHRELRSVGVATEIYNQIIDNLSTQCMNINGRFMVIQFMQDSVYNPNNYCQWYNYTTPDTSNPSETDLLHIQYGIMQNENICPRDYALSVDVQSWGSCSCWGNGGRRSKNGRAAICVAALPTNDINANDAQCSDTYSVQAPDSSTPASAWCTQKAVDSKGRVCPGEYYRVVPNQANNGSYDCSKYEYAEDKPSSYFENSVPEGI